MNKPLTDLTTADLIAKVEKLRYRNRVLSREVVALRKQVAVNEGWQPMEAAAEDSRISIRVKGFVEGHLSTEISTVAHWDPMDQVWRVGPAGDWLSTPPRIWPRVWKPMPAPDASRG